MDDTSIMIQPGEVRNVITLIQPNAVTNARYEYSQVEKDIMYFVIETLQAYMTREKPIQPDLFGGLGIDLEMKRITKTNNHTKVIGVVKGLIKKPISYIYNKNNKTYDVTTALISGAIHERNSGKITIKIPQEAIPVLLDIAAGFTAYNKNIALSIPSVYAKRMYELCCRWKDKGFLRISLDEFRRMFCVDDKFHKISELRENVLDLSQKLMTEFADLTFRYELQKENNSRAFNYLYIWISGDNQDPKDKANQRAYEIVFNFLYELFRNSKAQEIADIIADNKELKRAAERITRLRADINSGRIKKHGQEQYIRRVIQDEFKIPAEVMGESPKKRKQKEINDKIDKDIFAAVMKQEKEKKEREAKKKEQKPATSKDMLASFFAQPEQRGTGTKTLGAMLRGE